MSNCLRLLTSAATGDFPLAIVFPVRNRFLIGADVAFIPSAIVAVA
jgi:hypothetical protein